MVMMFLMPLLLISSAGGDLLSMIRPADFWEHLGVEVTEANMLAEMSGQTSEIDVDAAVAQLGSADYNVRQTAFQTLMNASKTSQRDEVLKALEQAGQSEDAEVSNSAKILIESFEEAGDLKAERRLMAIRTLGEMKSKKALPVLKTLLTSEEPFVAEYAKNAIAIIEGRALPVFPRLSMSDIKSDLYMLPKESGFLGQVQMSGLKFDPSDLFEMMGGPGGDEAQIRMQINEMIFEVISHTGNFRIDAVTFEFSEDANDRGGRDSGHAVVIVRGAGDMDRIISAIFEGDIAPNEAGVYFNGEGQAAIALKDGIVFMVGGHHESLPITAMSDAVKTGKGTLAENKKRMQQIGEVSNPEQALAWVAGDLPPMLQEDVFSVFQTVIGTLHATKDQRLALRVKGSGDSADGISELVKKANDGLKMGKQQIGEAIKELETQEGNESIVKMAKQLVKLLEDVNIYSKGKTAYMDVDADSIQGSLIPIIGWISMPMAPSRVDGREEPGLVPAVEVELERLPEPEPEPAPAE